MPSRCRRPRWCGVGVALLLPAVLVGCSSTNSTDAQSSTSTRAKPAATAAFCGQQHPAADCVVADNGRFAVAIVKPLGYAAQAAGVFLTADLDRSLARIAELLPGPRSDILIYGSTQGIIPGTGVGGFTDPATGQVSIPVNIQQRSSALRRTLSIWLRQALSHEIDHSVRIEAGPGFGPTLLGQLVSEGMASAFDVQVQPTIALPWTHALSPAQEGQMWSRARPLLQQDRKSVV